MRGAIGTGSLETGKLDLVYHHHGAEKLEHWFVQELEDCDRGLEWMMRRILNERDGWYSLIDRELDLPSIWIGDVTGEEETIEVSCFASMKSYLEMTIANLCEEGDEGIFDELQSWRTKQIMLSYIANHSGKKDVMLYYPDEDEFDALLYLAQYAPLSYTQAVSRVVPPFNTHITSVDALKFVNDVERAYIVDTQRDTLSVVNVSEEGVETVNVIDL